MHTLSELLETVAEYSGRLIAWLTVAMVLVTFVVVVLRYAFDIGWIAMQESVTYMHALVFMIGAAYTLKADGHVRVDIVYQRFGPRGKAWVELFGNLFLLAPVCLFIGFGSLEYVSDAWAVKEGSREAGGLPGVYLLKSVMLLMALLLLVQGLAHLLRNALLLDPRGLLAGIALALLASQFAIAWQWPAVSGWIEDESGWAEWYEALGEEEEGDEREEDE